PRARLGQHERPGRELEGRQPDLAGRARARRSPVKATGDHQVEDEEELALELEDDALAEAAEPDDPPALRLADRRIDGADEKWGREPDTLERLPDHARGQVLDVDDDVGKLGHARRAGGRGAGKGNLRRSWAPSGHEAAPRPAEARRLARRRQPRDHPRPRPFLRDAPR